MKKCVIAFAVAAFALVASQPAAAQDWKEKLAAAKEAAAKNAQAMRSYTWLEKTELSLKGEVKNTKVDSCRYGPDGKVQKTPVVTPPPAEKKRGLKGKIVAKKTGEMKEELESAAALVHRYVPPSPDRCSGDERRHARRSARPAPRRRVEVPGYERRATHDHHLCSAIKALRSQCGDVA